MPKYYLDNLYRETYIETLDKLWTFWLALLVSFFWVCSHCSLLSLSFPSCSFLLKPSSDRGQVISLICSPWTNEKTPIVTFDFMLHWLGLLLNTMAFKKRNQKRKTQQLSFGQNFIKSVSIMVQRCRKWENSFFFFFLFAAEAKWPWGSTSSALAFHSIAHIPPPSPPPAPLPAPQQPAITLPSGSKFMTGNRP